MSHTRFDEVADLVTRLHQDIDNLDMHPPKIGYEETRASLVKELKEHNKELRKLSEGV